MFTVVSIVKDGWIHSNWKKPKGTQKPPRNPEAKNLFEVGERCTGDNMMSAIRTMHMYQFHREGKFDKGAREESSKAELTVGMTFRVNIQTYMYEDKNPPFFPPGVALIPENTMVEMMIVPSAINAEKPGYGMVFATIRPLEQTLHSYLHPLGLGLLPQDAASAEAQASQLLKSNPSIAAQVEASSVVFVTQCSTSAFLNREYDGMYKLLSESASSPPIPGAPVVDILEADLMRFTNAGDRAGYAVILCDLAAALGALTLVVYKNPYFVKQVGLAFACKSQA